MNCEHPKECLDEHGGCGWCGEIADLRADNTLLRHALHQTAIVLTPGKHKMTADAIGYLVCEPGSVVRFERAEHVDSLVVLPGASVGSPANPLQVSRNP